MRFISGEHPLISCVTSRRCSRPSVFREGVRGDARLHGYIRWRLAFVGLLVPLISKTLFSASLHGITHSIHAVDSALIATGSASKERLLYGPWTAISPAEASKVGSAHSSITISYLGYSCARTALMKGGSPEDCSASLKRHNIYRRSLM